MPLTHMIRVVKGDFEMLYNKKDCGCGCDYDYDGSMREPMMMQPMMAPTYTGGMGGCGCGCPCPCDPIVEPAIEKCIKRDFCHEVRHICPVHTTVVNNHIFRHVYDPQFSCSEENVVTNRDPGCGCNTFR
jgi:hypothetical protein